MYASSLAARLSSTAATLRPGIELIHSHVHSIDTRNAPPLPRQILACIYGFCGHNYTPLSSGIQSNLFLQLKLSSTATTLLPGIDFRVSAHPGVELRANIKVNLPQMPPLRGGICMGVDKRNHALAPGLPGELCGFRPPPRPCFRVSSFGYQVSGFGFRVQRSGCRVSGFGFRVPGTRFWVPDFGFRVSSSGYQASGVGFQIWGFGLWVCHQTPKWTTSRA